MRAANGLGLDHAWACLSDKVFGCRDPSARAEKPSDHEPIVRIRKAGDAGNLRLRDGQP
jgi:hypothetical protein